LGWSRFRFEALKTGWVDGSELVLGFEVFLEGAGWVDGVELLGGVSAGELEDGLGPARVLGEEARHIVDVTVQDDPAAVSCAVLSDYQGSALSFVWEVGETQTFFSSEDLGHVERFSDLPAS
jgi:hypothetical protein